MSKRSVRRAPIMALRVCVLMWVICDVYLHCVYLCMYQHTHTHIYTHAHIHTHMSKRSVRSVPIMALDVCVV